MFEQTVSNLQQSQRRKLGDALEDVGGEAGDVVPVKEHTAGGVQDVLGHGGETRVHPVKHPARRVLVPVERVP